MTCQPPSGRGVIAAALLVFAISMALRMPSCYESFWLDELHSAWSVWGSLSEVGPRAVAGHQTPFYFLGLWIWKQFVGDSELALRLSSVLAMSLASVILLIGVARWSRSLAAGITSGLVLAIENNAIFFGTELRPYATVVLCSSIAHVAFLALLETESRLKLRGRWSGLIIAILLAFMIQPTSIGVLALLPISLMVRWSLIDLRRLSRFGVTDGLLLLTTATTMLAIWFMTLGESWQQRAHWSAFASANHIGEIMQVWDWLWLLVVPLIAVCLAVVLRHRSDVSAAVRRPGVATGVLALVAVTATCLYWTVSWLEWAPIWHRRYFVALLPTFACIGGGAVAAIVAASKSDPFGRRGTLVSISTAALLLVGLGTAQRIYQRLVEYPVALAVRGEDWRSANQWVNDNARIGDIVLLESGLIEAKGQLPDEVLSGSDGIVQIRAIGQEPGRGSPSALEYLLFPVRGPYSIPHHVGLHPWGAVRDPTDADALSRVYFLIRRPASQLEKNRRVVGTIIPFGSVSVVVEPAVLDARF